MRDETDGVERIGVERTGVERIDHERIDHESFVDLVRAHDGRLRGVAYRLLAGDLSRVDDVLQEAYLRAYTRFEGFRGDAQLGTWLYRIVTNACIDELRRSARRPAPMDMVGWDGPGVVPGPEDAVGASDRTVRALAALAPEQRVTVVLVDGEGMDHARVAELLGIAPGTVASRLSRARAAMRRMIDEQEER